MQRNSTRESAASNDIQVGYRMFGALIEDGTLSPEIVGKCYCGRYFKSARTGQRKSRTCSPEHRDILLAREYRAGERYEAKGRARNTERMRAVREAEKLVGQWTREGIPSKEKECLLWKWNDENGAVLRKRALYRILEGGVPHEKK